MVASSAMTDAPTADPRRSPLGEMVRSLPDLFQANDLVLRLLAHAANTSDLQVPITIYANGMLITGRTTSGEAFIDQAVTKLAGYSGIEAQTFRDGLFSSLQGPYKGDLTDPDSLPRLLHLADVKLVIEGYSRALDDTIFRFKVCDITGFHLGSLTLDRDDE